MLKLIATGISTIVLSIVACWLWELLKAHVDDVSNRLEAVALWLATGPYQDAVAEDTREIRDGLRERNASPAERLWEAMRWPKLALSTARPASRATFAMMDNIFMYGVVGLPLAATAGAVLGGALDAVPPEAHTMIVSRIVLTKIVLGGYSALWLHIHRWRARNDATGWFLAFNGLVFVSQLLIYPMLRLSYLGEGSLGDYFNRTLVMISLQSMWPISLLAAVDCFTAWRTGEWSLRRRTS